jgi:hypothetical protein
MDTEAARMGKKDRGTALIHPKALLLALFPALIITGLPYLTYLTKLPFTRYEMRVLCWFPGELVVAVIWQLAGKAASEDTVVAYEFPVLSQACSVVLYTMFFYLCLRMLRWFTGDRGAQSGSTGSSQTPSGSEALDTRR